jgi:hypothetical protein
MTVHHLSPLVSQGALSSPHSRASRYFSWFAVAVCVVAVLALLAADEDLRAVLGPIVAVIALTLLYLTVLLRRQGYLPLFEAATYFVVATAVYTVVPLVQFIMSGMECLNTGDYRLYGWAPTPREFGGFAWRHVLLLASFVFTYLLVRGKRLWPELEIARPPRRMVFVFVALILLLSGYFIGLKTYLGPSVSVYEGGSRAGYLALPHFVLQISNVLQVVLLTLKQCLIVALLTKWHRGRWRYALLLWIAVEVIVTVQALHSRTETVLLLLTVIVGYHHIVKRICVRTAFIIGACLLGGFLIFGLFRDFGVENARQDARAAWGSPTEFMILYGNAYDIHMRKVEGSLPPVPRQLYFSDLYRLVPRQILPFYKWDPAYWYLEVLSPSNTMGFVFGIVAQCLIGGDWIELTVRGVLLGLFFAAAHRAWRRYSGSFWATIAYLFILTWAYYAFRASSFDILYRLVYYLVPTILLVKLVTLIISGPVPPIARAGKS